MNNSKMNKMRAKNNSLFFLILIRSCQTYIILIGVFMFNFFSEIKDNLKANDLNFGEFNIINMSGRLLYVEGHCGLLTLSKESIIFKTKKAKFCVEGSEMILAELNDNTLKICGNIKKVEQI